MESREALATAVALAEEQGWVVLRDLEVVAGGQTVLRIPMVVWRLDEAAVLDRLSAIFVARGWQPKAA